ncbi:MAG: SRPBCC family protein [Bacteroidota bacterium]
MDFSIHLSTSITISAPKEAVWDALTNPAKIKEYLFGTNAITDWKVGSPIAFEGEWNGKKYRDKGTILDFQKGKLLKYSYWSGFSGLEDRPENYSQVTFTVESSGNKTTLTLNQVGFVDEKGRDHTGENWAQVFKMMKEIIEKQK